MHTKDVRPFDRLPGEASNPWVKLYYEFNQLKLLYRQGWLKRGVDPGKCETVAEHTLGVAVLALGLAEAYFPNLDILKILRMALLHDFGEIYAGDFTPADAVEPSLKSQLELQAVEHVLSQIPGGDRYIAAWLEFEEGKSPEARLVRQIDRLEMGFQASIYQHQGLVDPQEFMQTVQYAVDLPELQAILRDLQALFQ